jgi:hypothetical protein
MCSSSELWYFILEHTPHLMSTLHMIKFDEFTKQLYLENITVYP